MKKIYLFVFGVLIFYSSLNAQWVQTNPPIAGTAFIVTVSGANLFAVSYVNQQGHYFFVSTDNGATWKMSSDFGGERGPSALAGNGTYVYLGNYAPGVFLSTNNGENWIRVNSFSSNSWITEIAVKGEKVLVGTMSDGVHLSTNHGTDWTSFILGDSVFISSFLFSGTNIFTGTYSAGIFFTTDNGGEWTQVNNGLTDTNVYSLAASGTNIFCGTASGVYLSTNNGTNWFLMNNGLDNTVINSFAVSGTNVFAGTDSGGVYLSIDNGTSWIEVNEGLTSEEVFSLTINDENIFAGTGGGVFRRPLSEMIITEVDEQNNGISPQYILEYNYPNPFNPGTVIKYRITEKGYVTLKIYDILGKEITALVNEEKSAGKHEINFNASGLSSGVYIYQLKVNDFVSTKKMILMK